jgi:hypothetical protein
MPLASRHAMMRRRTRDQLLHDRVRHEIEVVRGELQQTFAETLSIVQQDATAAREAETWERAQSNIALTKALDRVADALDGVGNHLLLDRKERATQALTVEFLLRELVVLFSNPVPDGPAVLAGTIEPSALHPEAALHSEAGLHPEAALHREPAPTDSDHGGFHVGEAVEVRSRFQQRWVSGFLVAEVVIDDEPRRYRLLRRSDRELLPVTFEDADLRPIARRDDDVTIHEDRQLDLREHDRTVAEQKHSPFDVGVHRT